MLLQVSATFSLISSNYNVHILVQIFLIFKNYTRNCKYINVDFVSGLYVYFLNYILIPYRKKI